MNRFTDTLSDTILSKKLEACNLEELKSLVDEYPYAATFQLLYAKKLKEVNHNGYSQHLQQTLLYYSNPVLINHLIETEDRPAAIQPVTKPALPESSSESEQLSEGDLPVEPTSFSHNQPEVSFFNKDSFKEALSAKTDDPANDVDTDETGEDEEILPPLPEFKIEAIDPAKAELSFTPYYTVDYFAAQGVKLTDQNINDRFGTQLKSFTAWLKQMKRLPGANEKAAITSHEEKSIEMMAQRSLTGENADTEAMAEVWAKQGDIKKAIDIYKKLSLQIPAKSAYFAAKIDYLKK